MPPKLDPLRKELVFQLNGGNAHAPLEKVVSDFPAELQGVVPEGLPYSAWQLLEHLRIAQEDIVEFCASKSYREKKWPEDYWPKDAAPASGRAWNAAVRQIHTSREQFIKLISNSKADLFAPLASGQGQTLFHEACLIFDHNAYHLGEIVTVRRLLGAWPPGK
jgi:DinB superfamily